MSFTPVVKCHDHQSEEGKTISRLVECKSMKLPCTIRYEALAANIVLNHDILDGIHVNNYDNERAISIGKVVPRTIAVVIELKQVKIADLAVQEQLADTIEDKHYLRSKMGDMHNINSVMYYRVTYITDSILKQDLDNKILRSKYLMITPLYSSDYANVLRLEESQNKCLTIKYTEVKHKGDYVPSYHMDVDNVKHIIPVIVDRTLKKSHILMSVINDHDHTRDITVKINKDYEPVKLFQEYGILHDAEHNSDIINTITEERVKDTKDKNRENARRLCRQRDKSRAEVYQLNSKLSKIKDTLKDYDDLQSRNLNTLVENNEMISEIGKLEGEKGDIKQEMLLSTISLQYDVARLERDMFTSTAENSLAYSELVGKISKYKENITSLKISVEAMRKIIDLV